MGVVRRGGKGDRGVGGSSSRVGEPNEGRARGESACGGRTGLNLLAEPQGPDALPGIPPPGLTDHVELRGKRREADQLPRQRNGEVLERSRCGGTLAAPGGLPQRWRCHGSLLEASGSQRDWAKPLPPR